jgi:MFS transporter, DHA1 family, tetracycline resistance protein
MNYKKVYFALFLSALIDTVGFGIVIPLIPFYALKFGASPIEVTLLFSTYALMQFLFTPLWGIMVDRFGRRPMLLLSLASGVIVYLCLSIANAMWMLFACRAIEGMMAGSFLVAMVYVSDITTKENRAKGMGIIGSAYVLGICLGPAMSGMLVGSDPQNPNFTLPALFAAGLSLLGFIVVWFALPESKPTEIQIKTQTQSQTKQRQFSLSGIKELLDPPPTNLLVLLFFLVVFVMVGTQAVFALWSQKQFNWGPKEIAYAYLFWGGVSFLVQAGLAGPLSQKFGEAKVLFSVLIILCFGLFLIPFSNSLPLLLGSLAIVSSSSSLCRPMINSLLSQSAGAKGQGKILGFAESVGILAKVVSPIWVGFLFGSFGPSWPFWSGTVVMFVASIFAWQVATFSRLSATAHTQRQRKMKRLFDLIDYDKNGFIEPLDFEQAANTIADLRGLQIGSPDYWLIHSFWTGLGAKLQTLMDTDGDGKITPDEWNVYMSKRLDFDFADAFMKLIDIDGNGEIALDELKMFYQAYKIDTSQTEASFEKLDINQDGHISSEEMKQIFDDFIYDDHKELGDYLFLGI